MSLIRSKDTAPETSLRSELHRRGLRFRLHRRDLPGSPDIVLPRFRLALFVHGCFWHGHACRRGHIARSNKSYWGPKIERNRRRDRRAHAALHRRGWASLTIWSCQVERDVAVVADRVVRKLAGGRH
jgi:DNA mismatch endonuclease (patch repair protein)